MAFKMKGNPYKMGKMATKSAMNMGKKSPMKVGDPKEQTSTNATTNLLGRLDDYEANKAAKDSRDAGETSYRVGDLYKGDEAVAGKDAPASTKKEVAKRKAEGYKTQARNRAQSTEEYIAKEAKFDATKAKVAKKEKDRKAKADADKAEKIRRGALGEKGRKKEDKDKKKAAKKAAKKA